MRCFLLFGSLLVFVACDTVSRDDLRTLQDRVAGLEKRIAVESSDLGFQGADVGVALSGRTLEKFVETTLANSQDNGALQFQMTACECPIFGQNLDNRAFSMDWRLQSAQFAFDTNRISVRLPFKWESRLLLGSGIEVIRSTSVLNPEWVVNRNEDWFAYEFRQTEGIPIEVQLSNEVFKAALPIQTPPDFKVAGKLPQLIQHEGELLEGPGFKYGLKIVPQEAGVIRETLVLAASVEVTFN